MSPLPDRQVPSVYHRRIGEMVLTTLSDGFQDVSMATVVNVEPEEAAAMMRAAYRPMPRRTAVNCFLLRDGQRTILVDTGCGNGGQASAGKLMQNLAAAGVAPEDVDDILMTHLHPDHFGGLSRDGVAVFPRAGIWLSQAEHDYWHSDEAAAGITDPARRDLFFGAARRSLSPYAGRTEFFAGTCEIFPGVTSMPLPGHTPGHTGYLLDSRGDRLLIWGDIVHVQELQVRRPETCMAVDVSREACIETRKHILNQVAESGLTVAGMHLHFPGIANIALEAGRFSILPEAWRPDF